MTEFKLPDLGTLGTRVRPPMARPLNIGEAAAATGLSANPRRAGLDKLSVGSAFAPQTR